VTTEIDISLVVPAWNEEKYIARMLETVERARTRYSGGADRIEVIVVDNCSTDSTSDIAQELGCTVLHFSERCISAVRNAGAKIAQGELLCFADADYQIHPETFNHIKEMLSDPSIIYGGTGEVFERESFGIKITSFILTPLILKLMQVDGGVRYCQRSDFHAVSGFDEDAKSGEHIRLFRAFQRLGKQRSPTCRTATRLTARELGVVAAVTIHSRRKFDRHGEWHLLPMILKLGWYRVTGQPEKRESFVNRFWYTDRR